MNLDALDCVQGTRVPIQEKLSSFHEDGIDWKSNSIWFAQKRFLLRHNEDHEVFYLYPIEEDL